MKTNHSKLEHRQKEDTVEQHEELSQAQVQSQGREFNSAEEMLQLDAAQTEVPPAVEVRLAESIQQEPSEPADAAPWWKRMFL